MISLRFSGRLATMTGVLVSTAIVSACSSSGGDAQSVTASVAPSQATSASPPVAPSPTPSADPRSPQALAAQLTFTSPPEASPAVREALAAYEDFLRQFVVAEGLRQPDYPPLLARIDTTDETFDDLLLSGPRQAAAKGLYAIGPVVERVTDSAGNPGNVLIDTCTDYRGRQQFKEGSDEPPLKPGELIVRARVTMKPSSRGWVVSGYSVPDEQNCA